MPAWQWRNNTAEDAFADLMNQHASGMKDSHFVNSTGWPAENHYTTKYWPFWPALSLRLPEHYDIYAEKEFACGITQQNRNLLLWRDPSGSLSYTEEAVTVQYRPQRKTACA